MLGSSSTSNIFGTPSSNTSLFPANKPTIGSTFAPTRFGAPAVDTSSSAFKPFFGGTPATSTSTGFSFGTSTSQDKPISTFGTAAGSLGFGGVEVATGLCGLSDGSGSKDMKSAREMPLQAELEKSREDFKSYVKQQKAIREENCFVSPKNLNKTREETCALRQLLINISSGVQKNLAASAALKMEIAQALKQSEIAQRTKDTPASLQYENNFPNEYFNQLILQFEQQTHLYRTQINQTELYISSLTQTTRFTPHDLMLTLGKLHEIFVTLAAQLQLVHDTVKSRKEQFRLYRRCFGDNIVLPKPDARNSPLSRNINSLGIGPSPFSNKSWIASTAVANTMDKMKQQTGFGVLPSTSFLPSGLGSISSGNPEMVTLKPLETASQTFQLQKPPIGNKRGKH